MALISYRRGVPGDIPTLVETTIAGYATYASFAPVGWQPPDHRRWLLEQLELPGAWCEIASVDSGDCAHSLVVPASLTRLRDPDPNVGHVCHLFVRPAQHGTGVATALHARLLERARRVGMTRLRLFTAEGHARARRFYEREGWTLASAPEFVPELGLAMVEYRRAL